jgi:hypothetical protein
VAELDQFTDDPLISPGRIILGHSLDQLSDRVVDRGTTSSTRVGPLLGHEAAVPAQDRRRGHQAKVA